MLRQQRLAGRNGFGNFQRVIVRRKIGQRFVQVQNVAAFAGEQIRRNRIAAFELDAGHPHFAPDGSLEVRLPVAERFVRGAQREPDNESRA